MHSFFCFYMRSCQSGREADMLTLTWFFLSDRRRGRGPPVASWWRGGGGGWVGGYLAGRVARRQATHRHGTLPDFFPATCVDFIFNPSWYQRTFIFLLTSSRIFLCLLSLCYIHHAQRPTGVFGRFYAGRNDFFSHYVLKLLIE